jgi:hypothetical protein
MYALLSANNQLSGEGQLHDSAHLRAVWMDKVEAFWGAVFASLECDLTILSTMITMAFRFHSSDSSIFHQRHAAVLCGPHEECSAESDTQMMIEQCR